MKVEANPNELQLIEERDIISLSSPFRIPENQMYDNRGESPNSINNMNPNQIHFEMKDANFGGPG